MEATKEARQEAFDKALSGIIAQGGRSMALDGIVCAYRGNEGRACFIGQLINDTDYDTRMDNSALPTSFTALVEEGNEAFVALAKTLGETFCVSAQEIHDNEHFLDDMMGNYVSFAAQYNLDPKVAQDYLDNLS